MANEKKITTHFYSFLHHLTKKSKGARSYSNEKSCIHYIARLDEAVRDSRRTPLHCAKQNQIDDYGIYDIVPE